MIYKQQKYQALSDGLLKRPITIRHFLYFGWIINSLLFFTLPVDFRGQTSAPAKTAAGNHHLFKIPIVVSDRDGRRIPGLKKEDFAVFQDEIKQNITTFASEDEPISIALLIDTSGSTQTSLDKIKVAAQEFIELLNPEDRCLIATFDSQVKILTSFATDKQSIKNSLNQIRTDETEGTVMFNAVNQILQNPFFEGSGRKAIILLSDGRDLGSSVSRTELLNELQESDLSIYAIFYQNSFGPNQPLIISNGVVTSGKEPEKPINQKRPKIRKKGYTILIPLPADTYNKEEIKLLDQANTTEAFASLKKMTDLTAGRLYQSDTAKLSNVFKQIAGELRQVYLLGFEVRSMETDVHNLLVKVGRPGVVVNTRHRTVSK